MKKILCAVSASLVSLAVSAADERMKPGSYEYTIKMEMPGMPFAMPPQTVNQCVTQADVDKSKQFQTNNDQDNGGCEIRNMKQSGGKVTFDMACKDGSTGKAEYAFTPNSMTGKTVLTREGQPMTMNVSAKRTGDCK